jgi:fusaric acid resistance family protein
MIPFPGPMPAAAAYRSFSSIRTAYASDERGVVPPRRGHHHAALPGMFALRAIVIPRVRGRWRLTWLFATFTPGTWRQAARMTVAAVVAYLGTAWFGLPEGYWAVITCLVIVQGSLGATLSAGISRVQGTVIGALLGLGGALMRARLGLPATWILGLLVLPLSLLSARNPRYRLAPVTAALVTLAIPSGGGSFAIALGRIVEILLGAVIGIATAVLVLPDHGGTEVRAHGASALMTLGELVRHRVMDAGGIDELGAGLQRHIAGVEAADAEAMQERHFRLAGEPASGPLLRTLRRLRTDVGMIGRTAREQTCTEEERAVFAGPIAGWFDAASRALLEAKVAPDLAAVEHAGTTLRPDTPLKLVHTILCRDLGDLADRITERSRPSAPTD